MKAARHVPRIRWRRLPSAPVRLSAFVDGRGRVVEASRCVASLREDWERDGRRACDLEVFVLVEPGCEAEAGDSGARIVTVAAQESRTHGLSAALEQSSGAARDIVAVLAPDVVFLPGSVTPLLQRLQSDPDCGAVAPRRFLDAARQFQPVHPPEPSPMEHLWLRASRRFPFVARRQSRRLRARNLTFWASDHPITTDALAAPCIWMRRKVLSRARGLFHAARAGRLADLDLLLRVAEQGYQLVYEPRATILSEPAENERDPAHTMRSDLDRAAYLRRHCGALARAIEHVAAWIAGGTRRIRANAREIPADLGRVDAPPVLELGRNVSFLIELESVAAPGVLAGAVGQGAHFAFAEAAWEGLTPGHYRVRAIDRLTGRSLGAWRLSKRRRRANASSVDGSFAASARPS